MIIGSLVGPEQVSRFETADLDDILQVALDELRQNPIIDEQIRQNPVIMRELTQAVNGAVQSKLQPRGEHT